MRGTAGQIVMTMQRENYPNQVNKDGESGLFNNKKRQYFKICSTLQGIK